MEDIGLINASTQHNFSSNHQFCKVAPGWIHDALLLMLFIFGALNFILGLAWDFVKSNGNVCPKI